MEPCITGVTSLSVFFSSCHRFHFFEVSNDLQIASIFCRGSCSVTIPHHRRRQTITEKKFRPRRRKKISDFSDDPVEICALRLQQQQLTTASSEATNATDAEMPRNEKLWSRSCDRQLQRRRCKIYSAGVVHSCKILRS
jgi:hypothetical protein